MKDSNSTIGKQIQITSSPIYCQLKNKIDPYFGMDYESLLMSVSNISHTLGRYIGADVNKIELYSTILGLGKIDGGKATFDYLNLNIPNKEAQISEVDIMLYNLNKIFPDMEQKFDSSDLKELSELFSSNPTILEVKIITISYYLKLVAQNLKKMGRLDDKGATDFIFNQLQQIISNYKNTSQVTVDQEINSLASQFYNYNLKLNDVDYKKLNNIIEPYKEGKINKDDVIEVLNKYEITKEKKTKVR